MRNKNTEIFNEISKLKKEFEKKPITPTEVERVYTDKTGKLINIKTLANGTLVINGEVFKIYTPKKTTELQAHKNRATALEKFRSEQMNKRY